MSPQRRSVRSEVIDGTLRTPGVSAVRVCSEVINGTLRAPGVSAVHVCSEVMDAMKVE
ncbi:hypothetical protein [Roseiflexus sp.]